MRDVVEEARNPDSSAYPSPAHYAARLEGLCQELADEIERLRKDVDHWREARRSCIEAGDMMKEEIERLRGLLRERGWQTGTPQWCDWESRVREALGD